MRQVAATTLTLTLGFAMGLVFRGTENLGFLEWVMVLLTISAMAAGYYIRGMEFGGDEARPLPRSDERSNVIRLASSTRSRCRRRRLAATGTPASAGRYGLAVDRFIRSDPRFARARFAQPADHILLLGAELLCRIERCSLRIFGDPLEVRTPLEQELRATALAGVAGVPKRLRQLVDVGRGLG